MKTTFPWSIAAVAFVVFTAAIAPAALPLRTAFTGAKSERIWPLAELNTELPADWTGYEFLVIEFKASSSQRFELGLETPLARYPNPIGPLPPISATPA